MASAGADAVASAAAAARPSASPPGPAPPDGSSSTTTPSSRAAPSQASNAAKAAPSSSSSSASGAGPIVKKAKSKTGKKKKKGTSSSKKAAAAPPPPPPATWVEQVRKHVLQGPGLVALCAVSGAAVAWQAWRLVRRLRGSGGQGGGAGGKAKTAPAPCAHVKPSAKCVALADGSACVVRRTIAADNSCMFNAVAYCMHGSKQKAAFLRNVVAREVASDQETYSPAFLGMPNAAYCQWILHPVNWGGGIELSILARHYTREIAAWNIETGKQHVFGEEAGYPRQAMLIYTGTHYDALAIAKHPRAPESEDKTEFNPRTKTGKMIIAAAQRLTELSKKGGKASASANKRPTAPPTANGTAVAAAAAKGAGSGTSVAPAPKLKCEECQVVLGSQAEAVKHATTTGHTRFGQVQATAAATVAAAAATTPKKPAATVAAAAPTPKKPAEPVAAAAPSQAAPAPPAAGEVAQAPRPEEVAVQGG